MFSLVWSRSVPKNDSIPYRNKHLGEKTAKIHMSVSFSTHGGATYSQLCTMINIKKLFRLTRITVIPQFSSLLFLFLYNNCHVNEWGGALVPSFYAAVVTNMSQEKSPFLPVAVLLSPTVRTKKGTPLNPVAFLKNYSNSSCLYWVKKSHQVPRIQMHQCLCDWNTPERVFFFFGSASKAKKKRKKVAVCVEYFLWNWSHSWNSGAKTRLWQLLLYKVDNTVRTLNKTFSPFLVRKYKYA